MRQPILTFLVFLAVGAPLFGQQRQRPADPLTQSEIERASAAATAMAAERGSRERVEVVSVELTNVKPADTGSRALRGDEVGRHAIVTLFDYGRNEGISVLVDLSAARAMSATTIRRQAVPLGQGEIERAAAMALGNAEVRRLVRADEATYRVHRARGAAGDDVIEGLRVVAGDPDDPCSVDRCVDLFFRLNGRYLVRRRVTVNLTRETVTMQLEQGANR